MRESAVEPQSSYPTTNLGPGRSTSPEQNLAIAVITLAIRELDHREHGKRFQARMFIESSDLEFWCCLIGMDPETLRNRATLQAARALATRQRHAQKG